MPETDTFDADAAAARIAKLESWIETVEFLSACLAAFSEEHSRLSAELRQHGYAAKKQETANA